MANDIDLWNDTQRAEALGLTGEALELIAQFNEQYINIQEE